MLWGLIQHTATWVTAWLDGRGVGRQASRIDGCLGVLGFCAGFWLSFWRCLLVG